MSVDEQLTKEAAEKRQDVYFGQQVYQKESPLILHHMVELPIAVSRKGFQLYN
jgi:hypothetical protein